MKKYLLSAAFIFLSFFLRAQKIDSLYFNLYTDSLKKGSWNYINVDAKLSNGSYLPLTSEQLTYKISAGKLEGHTIWLDWNFKPEFITVEVTLKKDVSVKRSITIWVKKVDEQMNAPVQDSLLKKINSKQETKAKRKKKN